VQFKRSALLSTVPAAGLHQIEQETEERTYRRRQIIYFAQQKNDYVFMLVSGRVKLLRVGASGREVTLDIVSPGELFGEANMFVPNSPYGSSAEVLEDSIVYAMRRTSIIATMANNMDALREFASLEVHRRHAAEQRLSEFVFYDVPTRLAHLLGKLSSFYSRPGSNDPVMIKAKLTHQELANLVGSTRETTTLILNDFKRRRLIEFQGRKVIVLDADTLMKFDSHSETARSSSRVIVDDDDDDDDDDGSANVAPAPPRRRGRPPIIRRA
jgi:CRP/FNR family transcriptional regulator, cyclic AMP receptor protein